ncbi:MAG TPA: MAPEG family protein [Anaeromyxobacteraceae bacterium]
MPTSVPVTLLYGGLSALLVTALGLNVSRIRIATGVLAGQPQPKELTLPVRAHGNAAEWVPLGLVLLLVLELSQAGSRFALHLLGGSFLLARALHAAGFYWRSRLSVLGATLNYLVLAVMSIWAITLRFAG